MIKIEHLTLKYASNQGASLRDVSLSLEKGRVLSVVGRSGSGKSSLLRSISGFERPQSGCLTIGNTIMQSEGVFIAPEKRGVGLVSQHGDLFPHLTIEKNVAYGLKGKNKGETKRVVDELLDVVSLSGYQKKYPHELSGGEKQRVALIRAMAPQPKILLLDEPFSSLDGDLRRELVESTRQVLKGGGITSLFVTHHSQDALNLGDEVAVMHLGELVQQGSPESVYQSPKSIHVASLFCEVNDFLSIDESKRAELNLPQWATIYQTKLVKTGAGIRGRVKKVDFIGERRKLRIQLSEVDCDLLLTTEDRVDIGEEVEVSVIH